MISVIINTYNQEKYIGEALRSVLEQRFADRVEVVVVIDGSTDGSLGVIEKLVKNFPDRDVKIITKPNGGQATALNRGWQEASGDIIVFLDGDDLFSPNKLFTLHSYFNNHPEVMVIGNGIKQFSKSDSIDITVSEPVHVSLKDQERARQFTQLRALLGTSRLSMRKIAADLLFPIPEQLRFEADEHLFVKACLHMPVLVVPEILTHYRLHDHNLYMMGQFNQQKLLAKLSILQAVIQNNHALVMQSANEHKEEILSIINAANYYDAAELSVYVSEISLQEASRYGLHKKWIIRKLAGPYVLNRLLKWYSAFISIFSQKNKLVLLNR